MSPETRAFLAGVRHAEDPTPRDERRVLASVSAALAAGSITGASIAASKATKLFGIFGLSGAKLGGALLCAGAAVFVASLVPPRRGPAEPTNVEVPPLRAITTTSRADDAAVKNERAAPPVSAAPVPESSSSSTRTEARRATSLRREIELLAEVRAALERGHAGEALRRLDEHVTADRQFAAERSAARILALCSLARVSDAREAAVAFFRNHPGSVQARAVERSCAGERTNDER
jgi:hypothetical protein